MNLRYLISLFALPFLAFSQHNNKVYTVASPNNKNVVQLHIGDKIWISEKSNGKTILDLSEIAIRLDNETLGKNAKVLKIENKKVNELVKPVVKVKSATIVNNYNELKIYFDSDFTISIRVFNEGFAYRFGTQKNKEIIVESETGEYKFPENHMLWWGKESNFQSHNQVFFDYKSLRNVKSSEMTSLPLVVFPTAGPKIVITETDLMDYPGMWLKGTDSNTLSRVSAKFPKTLEQKSDRVLPITARESYIAKTNGNRDFPWRIFVIAEKDSDLITNQMPYLLSDTCQIKDTDWIKPGKVAWDWWNANNLYGVDFKAGINTQTYKYYIDFASKYGIENIIIDEGWYPLGDMLTLVPDINMEEIVAYGEKKNVGVILWCVWKTLDNQLDGAFRQFDNWGIKGIKVDFMNRDDQQMVNYYEKIAKKAAEHKLLVDFHGAYKPAGLLRMYPNVLTIEAVNGGEEFKWVSQQSPEHDLVVPFGRMLAGPMDFTPGAMHNAQEKDYKAIFDTPMSLGTRCHQLAMFVCYESPLQMLCDSPSNYYKEPECMEFLSKVPSVWDETVVLDAKVSDYLSIARRNGDAWFVGGMTDWDSRDMKLDFSFLPKGKKYSMTLYQDGVNANQNAIDFKQIKITVDSNYKNTINLAKGGGFAAMLLPIK